MVDKRTLGVEWAMVMSRGFGSAGLVSLGGGIILTTDNLISKQITISEGLETIGGILIFLSIPLLCLALPFLIIRYHKIHVMDEVLENGIYIQAEVIGVRLNRAIRIRGRHPYRVVCEYEKEDSGKRYRFISKNLVDNPTDKLDPTIGVYVNPSNYKHYYVDTDSVLARYYDEVL